MLYTYIFLRHNQFKHCNFVSFWESRFTKTYTKQNEESKLKRRRGEPRWRYCKQIAFTFHLHILPRQSQNIKLFCCTLTLSHLLRTCDFWSVNIYMEQKYEFKTKKYEFCSPRWHYCTKNGSYDLYPRLLKTKWICTSCLFENAQLLCLLKTTDFKTTNIFVISSKFIIHKIWHKFYLYIQLPHNTYYTFLHYIKYNYYFKSSFLTYIINFINTK